MPTNGRGRRDRTAGPPAQQGFYVYRNQRLLVAGSCRGLGRGQAWTKEESHRLARIQLNIPNTADAAWKIDIRKSTARPPQGQRERLLRMAEDTREHARRVFAHRGQPAPSRGAAAIAGLAGGTLQRWSALSYRPRPPGGTVSCPLRPQSMPQGRLHSPLSSSARRYARSPTTPPNLMSFPDGLYDLLLSVEDWERLVKATDATQRSVAPLAPIDAAERLVDALSRQLVRALDDVTNGDQPRILRQLELVNTILVDLKHKLGDAAAAVEMFHNPPQVLLAVHRLCGLPQQPATGVTMPWLFTAGKGSPSLLTELRRELAACDRLDILVSFITHSGVRKLLDLLTAITAIDATGTPRTRLRVLTTTYTGATELFALDELARLPGCEVRVSLDGRRTRLHAKAWLFHRNSGFGCAYVGSANLSAAALMGGLEWTVKFTQHAQQDLFERARCHFETLWEDREFQQYDPDNPHHREALGVALKRESGEQVTVCQTFFDIEPKTYRHAMLDALAAEREYGRWRNLVVAATGTGKTVVAAFDYRRTCEAVGGRPRLLFVAHREEIVRQAQRTYREVLRDQAFGELLAGGTVTSGADHLFATIDSVTARELLARHGPSFWHTVVVDECHRLAADRFDQFVRTVTPRVLLGLTATPERSDGQPIFHYFDMRQDGSPAVELRLWQALDLQLLAPFEYYACDDDTDFAKVPWNQAGEAAAIDKLVTGNEVRARLIVNEWRRLAGDPSKCRALVFCVSVDHARFMTDWLNCAGIPARCVVGETGAEERRRAPELLACRDVSALVTCDLYNEGVDLPSVDTLLLLRPTQSPVLFQQQIGRGLRLAPGKQGCLVLDFVGRHREEFRFDRLLSGITGLSRRQLISAVEQGFGSLPPGCHISLQRQAAAQVLGSLRRLVQSSWRRLRSELQALLALRGRHQVDLATFLHEQAIDPSEVYRRTGRSGWTTLKRDAGLLADTEGPEDLFFGRRFRDLLHIDDPLRTQFLCQLGACEPNWSPYDALEDKLLQMLTYQIDGRHQEAQAGREFFQRLAATPVVRSELAELGRVLQARTTLRWQPLPGLEDTPLCLHAAYDIRELLTAVDWFTATRRTPFRAGVLPLPVRQVELLFVTLDKRKGYHERITYHDYAISPRLFHWQSQNSAGPDTAAGRRYLNSPGNGWTFQLFVRGSKGTAYRACGPAVVEHAEGDRPMSIVWRLEVAMPASLFQEFSVLRGA